MMKQNKLTEKTMLQMHKKKKPTDNNSVKINKILVTINVLGSAGPMRFLVSEDDAVASVIDTVLKNFAREGRLPVLGFGADNFLLYCANEGSDALDPSEAIGSCGGRNFLLCKKSLQPQMTEGRANMMARKGSGWKAWLSKSLSLKI